MGYCFGILVSEGRLSCYKYVCGIFRWFQVNLGSEDLQGKDLSECTLFDEVFL